jgi:PAS domain-containing protein
VEDILGYLPHEVTGKSCWEYFHPDEIPFARAIQGRGISLDKAAVMNYARVKHKDGHWVGCECVFTVVHDVLVATTAIYRRGPKARRTYYLTLATNELTIRRESHRWSRDTPDLLIITTRSEIPYDVILVEQILPRAHRKSSGASSRSISQSIHTHLDHHVRH